ncbi:MAG: hypothetical protein AB7O49_02330 [Sphingomonadales bacterium]
MTARRLAAAALSAILLAGLPQFATAAEPEGLPSSPVSETLTCGQFNALADADDPGAALSIIWLDGLFSAGTGRRTVPEGWLKDVVVFVAENCRLPENARHAVIDLIAVVHAMLESGR